MSQASDYLSNRGITDQTATCNQLEIDLAPLDQAKIVSRLHPGCVPLWSLVRELLWFPVRSNGMLSSWITRPFPTLANGPKFVTPKGGSPPAFCPGRPESCPRIALDHYRGSPQSLGRHSSRCCRSRAQRRLVCFKRSRRREARTLPAPTRRFPANQRYFSRS
jgi:hypothetical protein